MTQAASHLDVRDAPVLAAVASPPRVLLLGNFLAARTASWSVAEELLPRLRQDGWTVISSSNRPGRLARLTDMLATIYRERHNYDLAHVDVYSGPSLRLHEICCSLLRRLGKPYVLTLHGGNLPKAAEAQPHRIEQLLGSAVAITSPSAYMPDRISVPSAARISVLPNPIDLQRYRFVRRARFRPHCLWLRAFSSIYDPQTAVEAIALLSKRLADVKLRMVGPDKGDHSLESTRELVLELGLQNRIELLGDGVPNAKVPEQLTSSDIFLNTSLVDNTPVSVLEAMASGLVVISSRAGGTPYLVDHEHNGLLVPAGDARALADAIDRVAAEPELAARLCRNGRELAEACDWNSVLPRWQQLLAESARS